MPKGLDEMTPDRLRREFVDKLTSLAGDFIKRIEQIEEYVAAGKISRNYLELNATEASKAIVAIRTFLETEIDAKIKKAENGKLRYRKAEARAQKTEKDE